MSPLAELISLAIRHHQTGNLAEAERIYRQVLQADPRHAGILNNLGLTLKDRGQLAEAVVCFRQALAFKPAYADALDNLGMALRAQGNLAEAAACCRQALRSDPSHLQAHNNLGTILQDQGKPDEAMECYREALRCNPRNIQAYHNLGTALMNRWEFAEAVSCFRQALCIRPDYDKAHVNLGNALKEQGRLAEAAESFRQALQINPNHAETINNLGNALVGQGLLAEGAECFRNALHLDPANTLALWNRSLLRLLQGDFMNAWSDFECRWDLPAWPAHGFKGPRWDGSTLAGKTVLVFSEQGFGDTIQFVRYLPMVKARGGRVLFTCQRALQKLLAGIDGVDQFVPKGVPPPAYDLQVPLLSLPGIFETTSTTIPATIPYLTVSPERIDHWRHLLNRESSAHTVGAGLNVGIAWQGNPKVAWDRLRSIPLECFEPLASVPGVRLISLQKGPGAAQLTAAKARFPVLELGERLMTFSDTAAVMKNLDLVISSDTSIVHLAGALGVPVWTVLHLVPDWRWQLDRPDCPWYPTMRLFRQRRLGDWREVFERIAAELTRKERGARSEE